MAYIKDFTTTYTIHNHEYTVTAPALFDSKTNEIIPDKKLDDQAAEIARQMYRKDMGLISPKDLKQYRTKVGLSQRNLAELTGLSPNTIALYEAGAFPTIANNRILKYLIENDSLLKQYAEDKTNKYSPDLIIKLKKYFSQQTSAVKEINSKPKYTAIQLANWLRVENYFSRECDLNVDPLTQMKAIKLLYFAYGRYLAANKSKLFTSPIIHLQFGPVITEVHSEFNGKVVLDTDKPDKKALEDYNLVSQDNEIAKLLEEVNLDYINYSAAGLSNRTHQMNSPWNLTKPGEVISDQLIYQTFKQGREQ